MYIRDEALMRLAKEESKLTRESDAYEKECSHVAFGYLNAYDVIRLFANHEEKTVAKVGARAREVIAEQKLPLIEFGTGQFYVQHGVTIPEVVE